EAFAVGPEGARVEIAIVRIEYAEGDVERYALPLAFAEGAVEVELRARAPQAIVAHVQRPGAGPGALFDGLAIPATARTALGSLLVPMAARGAEGELRSEKIGLGPQTSEGPLEARILRGEATTAVVAYGGQHLLRFHRLLEEGISAELEVGRFLTA